MLSSRRDGNNVFCRVINGCEPARLEAFGYSAEDIPA